MPDFPSFDHWFPPVDPPQRRQAPAFELRHPAEDEFATFEARIRDWCEGRGRGAPGRTWFRHFAGTSWVAEATTDRRELGILLGFLSADHPASAVVHLLAVDPGVRRRGLARALVERFATEVAAAGATTVATTWRPDDRAGLAFWAALGFEPDAGPGSARIYGVPAFADWDGPGEDRVLLARTTRS